jgi:hypothetical protein
MNGPVPKLKQYIFGQFHWVRFYKFSSQIERMGGILDVANVHQVLCAKN